MLTIKNTLKNRILPFFKTEIFLIVVLAFIIRAFFINLNYPIVFHPDEPTVVNSTINLRYNFNPGHFDWPTFYYYFTYPFFYLFEKIYFLLVDLGIFKSLVIEKINYYLISRTISAVFGAFTCLIVYKLLLNLKISKNYAILGACFMALIPFHVTRSSLALTDIPMVFFAGLAVLFLSRNLEEFKNPNFIWACFFAGLSVSTKYNGYMIFLSLVLFIVYIRKFSFKDFELYYKSALSAFMGFFIGTPYFIFDYQTFFISDSPKGALWQFQNVGKVSFYEQLVNFSQNLFIESYSLMGYLPLIFTLGYIAYFFITKRFLKHDNFSKFILILVIQFLYIFWSVSGVELQRSHYLMLAYFFLPVFSILFLSNFSNARSYVTISYLSFVALSIYVLYLRIDSNPVAKLYNQIQLVGDRKSFLVGYNNSDTEKLIDKLKLPKVKLNSNNNGKDLKTTHIITTSPVCQPDLECRFKLIAKIDSRNNLETVYFYEKK